MVLSTALIWQLGIPAIIAIICFIAKKFPRERLVKFLMPYCVNIGKGISKFLIIRFGKTGFDRVSEGIIVTLLDVLSNCLGFIRDGLIADNLIQMENKEKKE